MDKRLVVKHNAANRIFCLLFSPVIIAFWVLFVFFADGFDKLVSFVFLFILIALIYYIRWELILYKDKISFRRLFRHQEYPYSQVKYIKEYNHIGHRKSDHYLIIHLFNDKEIKVQSDCMNFWKCHNELLRHMSIEYKSISWDNSY